MKLLEAGACLAAAGLLASASVLVQEDAEGSRGRGERQVGNREHLS